MIIRETAPADSAAIRAVHARAFGRADEADLTLALLADPSAAPCLSLLAERDGSPVGHVLFTRVRIEAATEPPPAALLAPLAVVPEAQNHGTGTELVRAGLRLLEERGAGLVFVLGDPGYYTRFGFEPARQHGLAAPYPIAPQHADAWMVRALAGHALDAVSGRVVCAAALDAPEYWQE